MAGNSIGLIRAFYRLGVRYVRITLLFLIEQICASEEADLLSSVRLHMCATMLSRTAPPRKSVQFMEDYRD